MVLCFIDPPIHIFWRVGALVQQQGADLGEEGGGEMEGLEKSEKERFDSLS